MPNPLNPRKSSLLVFLLYFTSLSTQAQEYPNSLLWSISGNGLKKTSFLFGTIHLQDKRVFGFTDSVYHSIQSAEGFAMEVHPDSMMLNMFMNVQTVNSKPLKKAMNRKEYQKLRNKLVKEWKVDPDKLSVSDAYQLKRKLSMPGLRKDDMPAIVDFYLYSIARDQGKFVSGLEKVSDQLKLFKDIEQNFNPTELVNDNEVGKNFIEDMIDVYVNQDLNRIMQMQSMMGKNYEDKVLNSRNVVMVDNIDSLMHSLSYFVAIGAAHLPGPKGVIQLLRDRGYKVEPVVSSNHLPAGTYEYKNQAKWEVFSDPALGYKIAMPGRVVPLNVQNDLITVNNHMDFTSMKFYFISSFSVAQNLKSKKPDSLFENFLSSFSGKQQHSVFEMKRMKFKDSIEVMEIVAKDNNSSYFMKLRLALKDQMLYMIGVSSQRMEALKDEKTAYYFNSFEPAGQNFVRQPYKFTDKGFSVLFPVPPNKIEDEEQADPSVYTYQYSAPDAATGIYYVVVVSAVKPTYILSADTSYFNAVMEGFTNRTGMKVLYSTDTTVAGCNARYFLSQDTTNAVISKVLMLKRGGQVFNLIASVENDNVDHPDLQKFFSSVTIAPYQNQSWRNQSTDDNKFSTWAPGKLEEKKDAFESDEDNKNSYYAFDSVLSVTYEVTIENLNEFTWSQNDTSLLHTWMEDFILDDQQLLSYKYSKQGTSSGVEMLISDEDRSVIKKVKIILNGFKKYTAFTFIPEKFIDEPNQNKFFNDWKIKVHDDSGTVYTNSPAKLFDALVAKDSIKRESALNALYAASFDKDDFSLLLKKATEIVPEKDLNIHMHSGILFTKLSKVADNSSVNELKEAYLNLQTNNQGIDFRILKVLAEIKTVESFGAIRDVLEQRRPGKGEAFNFIYSVADSLLLAHNIYQTLISFSADSSLSLPLFYLHYKMLESGIMNGDDLKRSYTELDKGLNIIYETISNDLLNERYYNIDPVTFVLAELKTVEADKWLQKLLTLSLTYIKLEAAMQLLNRNKEVPAKELLNIAQDPGHRVYLYERLALNHKQKLFPSYYNSRKYFGEGYLYNSEEDEQPTEIFYITETEEVYAGKRSTFLMYKIGYEYEGNVSTYLGIAGPFEKGKVVIDPEETISGIYYKQEYIPGLEKKFLKSYLQQFSEE